MQQYRTVKKYSKTFLIFLIFLGLSIYVSATVTPLERLVPLGQSIVENAFDSALQDDDLSHLYDGEITFKGTAYDVSEELQIRDNSNLFSRPYVATSLMTDDDYHTDVFFEISKDNIRFAYKFDEDIDLSQVSLENPLSITFMGINMQIIEVLDNQISLFTGEEHYMNTGDIVQIAGKNVKLIDVGTNQVVVEVDGVSSIVAKGEIKTVNGIDILPLTLYSRIERAESSAILILGSEMLKTYYDGDSFIGEDENDPEWVWDIRGMLKQGASAYTEPELGGAPEDIKVLRIENDFAWNDDSDDPAGIGECITLPNDYVAICLESLSVSENDYADYNLELENGADLSDAWGAQFSEVPAIHISTTAYDGIELPSYNPNGGNIPNSLFQIQTSEVWLYYDESASLDENTPLIGYLNVFYLDKNSNQIKWHGSVSETGTPILAINFGNTNGLDENGNIRLLLNDILSDAINLRIDVNGDSITFLEDSYDDIDMNWGLVNGKINSLGSFANTPEGNELSWGIINTNIGTKDEDHMGYYGIIIKNPQENSLNDKVKLAVPNDQVFANVLIGDDSLVGSQSNENPQASYQVDRNSIKFIVFSDGSAEENITITNTGDTQIISFSAGYIGEDEDDDGDRLLFTYDLPTSLAPGQSGTLTVHVDVENRMDLGTYFGKVTFTANGIDTLIDVETEVTPNICSANKVGNLQIKIDEPDYGEKYNLGDIIEIDVDVDNEYNKDLDVQVKAILYDKDMEMEVTSAISDIEEIDDGDDANFELQMPIPNSGIDINHEYFLYVKAYEEGNEINHCDFDNVKINLENSVTTPKPSEIEYTLDLTSLIFTTQPDSNRELDVTVTNTGNVNLTTFNAVYNDEDGLYLPDEHEDGDGDKLSFWYEYPTTLAPGEEGIFTIHLEVENRMDIGSYLGDFTFTANGLNTVVDVETKVLPKICKDGPVGGLTVTIEEPDNGENFDPGDEMEIDVSVDNDYSKDIDVRVEAILYNFDEDEEVKTVESNVEEIDDGDEETFNLKMIIPTDDLDEDDTYYLYVKAYEDGDENDHCAFDSVKIELEREDDDVIIEDFAMTPSSVKAGGKVYVSVDVENIGTEDQDDVWIEIVEPELGIDEDTDYFKLDEYDDSDNDYRWEFYFTVPANTAPGDYYVEAVVRFNDDDGSDSKLLKLTVEEGEAGEATSITGSVVLNTEQETVSLKEGQKKFTLPLMLENKGDSTVELSVDVTEYSSWAELISIEAPKTLNPGDKYHSYVYLQLKEGVEPGIHNLRVNTRSGESLLTSKLMEVNVPETVNKETNEVVGQPEKGRIKELFNNINNIIQAWLNFLFG